nr:GDSL esterase/lipase [Tanacetum cinerariifolium]
GSESRPPMLNKENYVPWSSRVLRYAKSRPNGKLVPKTVLLCLTKRTMFHGRLVFSDDELTEKELKHIEADDQAIQTILLGLPEDIYAAVDSCETAQEIWLRVQQMMKGSDIRIQEKKAKMESTCYHCSSDKGLAYSRLHSIPEWSRHVTIVHQTKDLHTVDYTQLYDFLKYNQKEVDKLKVERLAKTQDPLAIMAGLLGILPTWRLLDSGWRQRCPLFPQPSVLIFSSTKGDSQPLVQALFIFGDSVVDVGNNNNLETLVKSNFPPYGRDFINNQSTGRFCNGKLASDFTGENLGFTSYPPPILSKEANGKNLLLGANFASGGSGYYETTAKLYLGARKIGVSMLPPIGCLPASITIFGEDSNECVDKMNKVAEHFNKNLNAASLTLKSKLSGLNLVVLDIYKPLYDLVQKPTDYGFFEARKACCGENLGFTSYPPPILSKEANGKNLLLGANFASGGSGYYETTAKLYV